MRRKSCFCFLWGFPYLSPQQRAKRQKDASGGGLMSAKDCYVEKTLLFCVTFFLFVLFVDVVLYAVPLIFVFLHLFYGHLMYLVVEVIAYRRRVDCNLPGIAPVHGVLYGVVGFREFTLFGFIYLVLTTATALMLLFIALRMGQSEDDPRQQ
jgi:hypothetical protein